MLYEIPEVFEIGRAEELTLGTLGWLTDAECHHRMEDSEVGLSLS